MLHHVLTDHPAEKVTNLGFRCLQVFDSGLIGEGVLHSVAWAKARLLQPDAVLVPQYPPLPQQCIQIMPMHMYEEALQAERHLLVLLFYRRTSTSSPLSEGVELLCDDLASKAAVVVQVPSAATVFCQPIQMRTGNVHGLIFEQANTWQWRADYEGIDLPEQR